MHEPAGFGFASSPLSIALASTLAVAALFYLRGWLRIRHIAVEIGSPWRPCAFVSGALALWVVGASPLARWHHALLSIHMVQHLLLSLVAAPLILLAAPILPLREGIPWRVAREGVARSLEWPPMRAGGRALADPATCWTIAILVFIGWHVPPVFELSFHSASWHAVEYASFFGSGLLFWWPVIQPWPSVAKWPRWSIPLYLFFATLPCDALSAFLAFSDRVVYAPYASATRHGGMTALQDQVSAGALMWLCVTIAYGIPAAVIINNFLAPQREPVPASQRYSLDAQLTQRQRRKAPGV
jgi:cytochrome c oxidase assembly factor CtaG